MFAPHRDVLLTFSKTLPRSFVNRILGADQPFAFQITGSSSQLRPFSSQRHYSSALFGFSDSRSTSGHVSILRPRNTINSLNARSFVSTPFGRSNSSNDDNAGDGNGKKPPTAEKDDTQTKNDDKPSSQDVESESKGKGGVNRENKSGSDSFVEQLLTDNPEGSMTEVSTSSIEPISVPKTYPQLLAIPLNRRPLFPGFYKSLYIKDPQAIAAIQELMKRRQPYVGIFLSKDDEMPDDVITNIDQVHRVGVFAQVTNVYQAGPEKNALTVVVYPHRRIRLKGLVGPPETVPDITEKAGHEEVSGKVADVQSEGTEVNATSEVTEAKPDESLSSSDAGKVEDATPEGKSVDDDKASEYLPINQHFQNYKVSLANVDNMDTEPYSQSNNVIKATTSEILNVLKEISSINPLLRDQIITFSIQTGGNAFADAAKLADFAAAVSAGEPTELQSVLESLVVEERLKKALVVVKNELNNAKLQQEIAKEVDKKITRRQQEYFLMEQLKSIKKELGVDTDGKDKLIEKFRERGAKLAMPDAVKKVFEEELSKLQHLEAAASEFNVTRNYLDWLTQIPWGQYSKENFDIKHASTVLDEDHYGLKDVKDRILEFIAVGKLRGTVEGKIICLQGPPGVGKTSIGKSIARALGREFFRFSVGGLTDVAEIKGHRRTYVGAMPGKVVQALKKVQTENPLIMIDEIDKLGRGHQGDPASALLELLDPEQNNSFLDHYMDVPLDLSKVLFVCTANMLETIPGPLLDRMEVITLSGYVAEEKIAIASKYLSPTAREAAGLKDANVNLTDEAIEKLIRFYCRESGVRNLKKHVDKVFRKAALKIVKDDVKDLEITGDNLKDYVGSPTFTADRMYEQTPPGVVMGLAWTSMGGSSLYIESVLESAISDSSKPHFHRTGQLGDVMKESATIAYTYARSLMTRRFPDNKFFDKASIHLHVPEGATPKDGPSAGCTMVTSLMSLALNKPVIPDVAMTGEITLTGKILKIGGVKEKTIAAKRSGVKKIIFPAANKADWDELPDYVKDGIEPHFVNWYEEIFSIVLAEEAL